MPNYSNFCPNCDSINLAYSDNRVESEFGIEYEAWCRDCGEEWVEIE